MLNTLITSIYNLLTIYSDFIHKNIALYGGLFGIGKSILKNRPKFPTAGKHMIGAFCLGLGYFCK
jgi:hypothetical protein